MAKTLFGDALLMFLVTVLTISIKVTVAAMRNPVDSLRYE